MKIANFFTDLDILQETQAAAAQLLQADPNLTRAEHQALRRQVVQTFEKVGGVLN